MAKLSNSNNNKLFFILLMIVVFIRSALRSFLVGNDTETYLHIFNAVSSIDTISEVFTSGLIYTVEIGYLLLNWFCYNIFTHYQSILIVSSILIFLGYYKFLRKYTGSLLFAFAIFFLLRFSDEAMNIIRQSIAIIIILKSYDYIKKNNKKKYIIAIIVAMLLHKSAIVFLPAWWICNMNFNKRMIFRFLLLSLIVMIMLKIGTTILFSLMGGYANYMSDDYEYASGGKIAPLMNTLMYSIMLLFVNYQIKKTPKSETSEQMTDMKRMRNLLFVGVCILIISIANALIFRVAIYYYIFIIALLPNAVRLSKNRSLWSCLILISLVTYYSVVITYRPEWNFVYPYSFFWEQPFLP